MPSTPGRTTRPLQLAGEAEDAVAVEVIMSAVGQPDIVHAHHALVAQSPAVPRLHELQLPSRRSLN